MANSSSSYQSETVQLGSTSTHSTSTTRPIQPNDNKPQTGAESFMLSNWVSTVLPHEQRALGIPTQQGQQCLPGDNPATDTTSTPGLEDEQEAPRSPIDPPPAAYGIFDLILRRIPRHLGEIACCTGGASVTGNAANRRRARHVKAKTWPAIVIPAGPAEGRRASR